MKQKINLLLAALFILSATGCGANLKPINVVSADQKASTANSNLNNTDEEPGYSCPEGVNVYPTSETPADAEGIWQFRVCSSLTSTKDFIVKGSVPNNQTVCVYPARAIKATSKSEPDQIKNYIDGTQPYSKCVTLVHDRAKVSFADGVEPNALFIAQLKDDATMKKCLLAKNAFLCPVFSYGTL